MTYELPDEEYEAARLAALRVLTNGEPTSGEIVDALTPIIAAHFERVGAEKMREAAEREVQFFANGYNRTGNTHRVLLNVKQGIRALPLPSQATNPTEEAAQ